MVLTHCCSTVFEGVSCFQVLAALKLFHDSPLPGKRLVIFGGLHLAQQKLGVLDKSEIFVVRWGQHFVSTLTTPTKRERSERVGTWPLAPHTRWLDHSGEKSCFSVRLFVNVPFCQDKSKGLSESPFKTNLRMDWKLI